MPTSTLEFHLTNNMAKKIVNNQNPVVEKSVEVPKFNYWRHIKKQFWKRKSAVWSLRYVFALIVVAFLADILANEKPLYCQLKGNTYFPIFRSYAVSLGVAKFQPEFLRVTDWKSLPYQSAIFPPVPYSPQNFDFENRDYKSPLGEQKVSSIRWRHFMGTDQLGRDVLSGMIHGTRTALLVGVVSMSLALIIGIIIGVFAGYYGDYGLSVTRLQLWLNTLVVFIGLWLGFFARTYSYKMAIQQGFLYFLFQLLLTTILICTALYLSNKLAKKLAVNSFFSHKTTIPLDIWISRLIEIKSSIPIMLLILSIVALMKKPSLIMTMVVIGLTAWTPIAKYLRAELLKIRNLEYIQSAKAMGFQDWRIILRHALPNGISSVLVALAFGIAMAILLESSLSFLGIGVSPEEVTWGSLLSSAKGYYKAWWLAVFPGMAIFCCVLSFNLIGEGLADAMNPKLKQ